MKFGNLCMITKKYTNDEHYKMLCNWWVSWKWDALPSEALPQNGLLLYSDCGVPVCAGFVYQTDSCIAWIEHIISNKQAPKDLRRGAIEFLITELSLLAKELGFIIALTSSKHNGLISKFEQTQYVKTDLNTTILTRIL